MTSVPVRVLLADDHPVLREGLAAVLRKEGFDVVAQADSGANAVALFGALRPNVCIVDLRMRPMDGVQVTSAIRAMDDSARVILLSSYDTDEEVFRGLSAGAASYLLKDVVVDELVETIHAVHRGQRVISPAVAARLAEHLASAVLTPRQREVLACLHQGRSNMEIAGILFISEGTVKTHLKTILRKLGARDRMQAVSIAIRRGLVQDG